MRNTKKELLKAIVREEFFKVLRAHWRLELAEKDLTPSESADAQCDAYLSFSRYLREFETDDYREET